MLEPSPRKSPLGLYLVGILLAVASLGGVFFLGTHKQGALAQELEKRKQDVAAGPFVRVAKVQLAPAQRSVTLISEVRANLRATIYAKVSGYVKEIRVDKGDAVQKGQVLATLESPDADQALEAARTDLALRNQLLARTKALAPSGVATQVELEQAEANQRSAQAQVARALANKAYEVLRAPFAGVVTARYVDPGALLPAATGSTQSAQPLIELAQLDRLRIAVQLGQEDAAEVRVGDAVQIALPSGEPLKARVSRLSRALDLKTRTMLAEVDLVKPPEGLLPGSFAPVTLTLQGQPKPLIPAEALISREGKLLVAVVEGGKIHLVPIRTGVDDGRTVEVLSGLRGGELVALNLGGDARDGAPVQIPEAVSGMPPPR